MKNIELPWKEFSLNLQKINDDLKVLYPQVIGTSADSKLTIHCSDEMADEHIEEIKAYWESLTAESIEATSYKSAEQIKTEAEAAKATALASARAKLSALGLDESEISAIIGV